MSEQLTTEQLLQKATKMTDTFNLLAKAKINALFMFTAKNVRKDGMTRKKRFAPLFTASLSTNYKYPAKHIEIEHNVMDRVPNYYCDIVIHESEKLENGSRCDRMQERRHFGKRI